ncbi:Bifunctional protein PutA [Thalassoglobus neptunius]|uniref:Bifunctional protein PutA n=1 Tax=Thalassoglobus neptunius TaxID=1938619 RepID=A0A5C5X2E1_9PLAN|nr:proline dehydrogenase family protein [Thalassoglobus neptunius]TWT56789.1 Bifunctional protein PutA [Thalassoglobus neptunius]
MTKQSGADDLTERVEEATQRIGRELWSQLSRRKPTVFERRWWLDHILEWAMQDESVKIQMFRFVDVLPMLKSSATVTQHLQEYFDEVRDQLPVAARLGLDVAQPDSILGKALALNARNNARKMAERFIAGEKPEEVLKSVARLRKQGLAFSLDLLGEAIISDSEADAYQQAYLHLIENLAPEVNQWPDDAVLDQDHQGWIPKCQVSLKLSGLVSHFRPVDADGMSKRVKERLRPIFRLARELNAYVHIDMENYECKPLTLQIFQEILMEDEFRDWPDCGIVIQAYLPDAGDDLQSLLSFAKERGTSIGIRLVKGAYWDYETITAEYRGWPCPVYTNKWESDHNFEVQTRFLFENYKYLRPAIASHNLRSLAHAIAWAEELKIPANAWEIQMLYGMAEEQQQLFSELGHRVRIYTPFGQLLPGMSYLVRRLLENTSNESFLRLAYDQSRSIDELLKDPQLTGQQSESQAAVASGA